jgi:nitrate reductase delta subunit
MMARTLKVLSALLTYPEAELQDAVPEMRAVLAGEALLPAGTLARLNQLLDEIGTHDLYDLQERYVLLFDRGRTLSLHLFEHIHGEGRDRGQAMVDLAQLYESHGLVIGAKELPDFLPLFLEFLSTLPLAEAREFLARPLHIIAALRQRLKKRRSPYAAVFRALEAIAQGTADRQGLEALLAEPEDDPGDLEALDKTWAEEPVTFGPGESGCTKAAGMVERMRRDPSQTQPEK